MKRLAEQTDGLFEEDSGLGESNLTPPKVSRTLEADPLNFEYQTQSGDENWFESSPFAPFGFNSSLKGMRKK